MVGFQRASGGTILLDGENINSYVGETAKLAGIIGYCPQTNVFDGLMSVKQNLTLFAKLSGIESSRL